MFREADLLQPLFGTECGLMRDKVPGQFVVAYMSGFPREFRMDSRPESLTAVEQLLTADPLVAGEALLMFASDWLVPGLAPASGLGTPWALPGECDPDARQRAEGATA
jgi:hypothetical protein